MKDAGSPGATSITAKITSEATARLSRRESNLLNVYLTIFPKVMRSGRNRPVDKIRAVRLAVGWSGCGF
jgi:hypothetical protein